jgi:arginine decarboxylase
MTKSIILTSGVGAGVTPLAAFDTALMGAGVSNYNLIPLSSVIPPGSAIVQGKYITPENEYGDRLYVVMACQRETVPGKLAVAGIGWTQMEDGRGLFVEFHDQDRGQMRKDITNTLNQMISNRSCFYGPIKMKMSSIRCVDKPVCALVIAVYKSSPWNQI